MGSKGKNWGKLIFPHPPPIQRRDNRMEKLFKEIHGSNNPAMIPVSKFNGRYELTLGLKSYEEEIKILKEKIPHLIDHIYFIPKTIMQSFTFYKDNLWLDVYSLEWNFWESINQQELIEKRLKIFDRCIEVGEYEPLFSLMEKKILIPKYIELFESIPVSQKYNCFRDLWTRSEYGFDQFKPSFLKKVFSYKEYSIERNESMLILKEEIEDHETVIVYRGVTPYSTPYNKAISWTLDIDTAEWFASRFDSKGKVMKAEIHINEIYDYLHERNEKEVFLNPKKLMNTEVFYYI
jgi:hypothetical protein